MIFGALFVTFTLFYALGYFHARATWKVFHDEQMVKNNSRWTEAWTEERQKHTDALLVNAQLRRDLRKGVAA